MSELKIPKEPSNMYKVVHGSRLKEIEERLSVHIKQEDYRQWLTSDIAKLRLDAKYLLKEVKRLDGERDKAIEILTELLKHPADDICSYCKNEIKCQWEKCEYFCKGVGDAEGKYPHFKWSCRDFDYGTCQMLQDTPCNGCFDNDYSGFIWKEWRKYETENHTDTGTDQKTESGDHQ